jgi:hypothetical protein
MRTVMISTRLAALTGAAAVILAVASGPATASPGPAARGSRRAAPAAGLR